MNRDGRSLRRFAKLAALTSIPALLTLVLAAMASAQQPTGEATPASTPGVTGEATPASTPGVTGEATLAAPPGITGEATSPAGPTATPNLSIKTLVHIDVDPGPFKSGQEFEARVMVDNVDHLASFQVVISYDPKRLQPAKPGAADQTPGSTPAVNASGSAVKAQGVGDIFTSSPRSDVVTCGPVADQNSTVTAYCVTRALPVCLGGPDGASGSGLLAAVFFKSKGGGPTTLALTTSQLVRDDYADCTVQVVGTKGALTNDCLPIRSAPNDSADQVACEPDGTSGRVVGVSGNVEQQAWVRLENLGWASTGTATSQFLQTTGQAATIPNRQQNADIQLTGGGSSHTALYIVIAAVVVVVVLGGGAGAYLWSRRRPAGPSA